MNTIETVGELKQLITNLPDDMAIESPDGEILLAYVADYQDVPENQRPKPVLVIE